MTMDTSRPLNLDLTGLEDGQLATLIRTVHEARFPEECWEPAVWLSPFVIDLHVAAIGEQRDRKLRSFADRASRDDDVEDEAERYEQNYASWMRWRRRRHEQAVVQRRIDSSRDFRQWFSGLTPDEVRPLFRPFEMDAESAADLIAYARRTTPYLPDTASAGGEGLRPYARSLPGIDVDDRVIDVFEVAVLRPGSSTLTEREATSRPEETLRRLGVSARAAVDCVQNAWHAGRGALSPWCGVLPEDTLDDD